MTDNTTAAPSTRAAHTALLKKAKVYVKPGSDVVPWLKESDGSWLVGKAVSKGCQLGTRKSSADKADDQHVINNEATTEDTWVVQIKEYERTSPLCHSSFWISKQRCSKWLCNCGLAAVPPCFKRHRSMYPACRRGVYFSWRPRLLRCEEPSSKRKHRNKAATVLHCSTPCRLENIEHNLDQRG